MFIDTYAPPAPLVFILGYIISPALSGTFPEVIDIFIGFSAAPGVSCNPITADGTLKSTAVPDVWSNVAAVPEPVCKDIVVVPVWVIWLHTAWYPSNWHLYGTTIPATAYSCANDTTSVLFP